MKTYCRKLLRWVFAVTILFFIPNVSKGACPGINLSFTQAVQAGCGIPRAAVFDNTSTGGQSNNVSYIWKVNGVQVDSTFGTGPNFNYNFLTAGNNTVRLIVISGNCRDSIQQNVNITSGSPRVYDGNGQLSYTPVFNNCILNPTQNANYTINISSNATLNNYNIIWGDGTNTTGASLAAGSTVSHTYNDLGLFNLKIVTRNGACWDTLSGTVYNMRPVSTSIKPLPAGQLAGCAPHTITFQDTTEFALPGTILVWTFGDGTVITRDWTQANKPISHTYQKEASQQCIFTVTLRAYNPNCNTGANNASTYSISPILIFDEDIARINPPTNLCQANLTYTFGNSSTDNCITGTRWYYWDWGDGTNTGWINSKAPQTHTYPRIDTFTVMLIDSNACGSDTTFATVVINKAPTLGYTISPKIGCAPLTVNFKDTSLGIGNGTQWTFTGITPGTSTSRETTRTYNNSGTYPVRLRVSNACSTNIQVFDTIRVYSKPNVAIGNARSGCVPHTVQYQNNTTNQSPNATYLWDFGNGVTSTLRNPPAAVYNSTGDFVVKLVVTDTCGKDSQMVTIKVSTLPNVSFTATEVCRGAATQFTSTSSLSPGDTVSQYKWYFGNGDSAVGTSINQTYIYGNYGTFNAVLQITTDKTCMARDTMSVSVKPSPVISFANTPTNICDGAAVNFNGTVTSPAPTTVTSYKWNFNTGDTARVEDTVYRFPTHGTYQVVYSANNSGGCSSSVSKSITVHPAPDARPFVAPLICRAQHAQFSDSSTVVSGSIVKWYWDFDSNGTIDDSTQHPTYAYNSAGAGIKAKLTVVSNNNCSNTDSLINLTVNNKPTAAINPSSPAVCLGDTFSFSNNSLFGFAYEWDFGDGSEPEGVTSTAPLKYSYTDTGTFTVKLLAVSMQGCKDSTTTNVITRPLPDAEFSMPDTIGCAPKLFSFTNTSKLANAYKWFVNDIQTSTQFNRPDTSISLSGQVVSIKLVASNQFNCKPDTAVKTLYTFGNPTPDFTMSSDSGCGPLSVNFTNTTPNGINYTWRLGNGESASSTHASSTYLPSAQNDSLYQIKLIASNGPGCSDSITKTIRVFPKPESHFTPNITNGCAPLAVSFTNTSNHKFGGNINDMTFAWNFGNNTNSTQTQSSSTFLASNIQDTTYTIQLIAWSKFGCSDTSNKTIIVFPNPTSRFTPNDPQGCGPHQTSFTNTSIPNDTGSINVMSFVWNFGNGSTSNAVQPNSTFTASATKDSLYQIRLIALSEHGCRDTSYQNVRVFPKPKAQFTSNVNDGCGPLPITFTNQSVPNDTGSIDIMSFVWDFGNGFNAISANTNAQFTAAHLKDTTYRISLRAISEHGCVDTTSKQITVHPKPVTAFTQDKNTGCGQLPVAFTNMSQLASKNYWSFGNGDTSMQTNPTYTFASFPVFDSIYEISLTTQTIHGCLGDTVKSNVIARYSPLAAFFSSSDSVCGSGNVAFFNSSLGGATNSWNFANGQTSAAINPAVNFTGLSNKDTTYQVRLVVTSPYGCRDTAINPIKVNPLPDASFANVTPGCTPHSVKFTNTSLRGSTYEWDFGDATSSDSIAPTKLFTNNVALVNRIYPVTLKAISASGCIDTMKQNIVVYPLPVADFTSQKSNRCDTTEYEFNNSSQGASNYLWNFGDGTTANSSTQNPTHFFRTHASLDTTYQVKLLATSVHGCKDSIQKTVLARPLVKAQFTVANTSACGSLNPTFTNQSRNAINYFWEFGDGVGSNQQTPNYTYNTTGTYSVKLTAYNQFGCSDTITKSNFINIYEIPKAVFYHSPFQSRQPNTTINFYDSSILSTGTLTHVWNFGDPASGTNNTSSIKNPTHNYSDSGTFSPSLVVVSNHGCRDTAVKSLTILPYLPVPNFTYNPSKGCLPHKVTFTNTSLYADSFEWDFGDGNKSTLRNPEHTFINEGKYTVSLLAKGPGGRVQLIKDTIITVYPLPRADFTASKTRRCDTTEYVFNNASTGAATYRWNFGDNQTSTTQTPTHFYATHAVNNINYTIKLVVTSVFGCSDSMEKSITVNPLVKADFTAVNNNRCQGTEVEFTNQSTNATSYFWLFGDGAATPQASPKHSYTSVGSYLVTLIAYNNFGCSDTAVKSNYVNIYDLPTASFSYTPFEPRQPNTAVNFNNLSFINNGTLTYEWNFGDPSTGTENASIQQNPTHTFSDSGNYVVTLKAISNHGCEHITTRTVRIFPHPPVPAFTYTPDQGCRPLTVTFNSDATLYADQFTWEFGDGGRSNEKNPVHTYKNASSEPYSVTLIVSGPGGREQLRKDTIITVFDLPKPNFVANPNMVYLPDAVSQFTNLSFGATKTKWLVRDELMKTVGSDTSYNTQFRFTETGKYTITMYVENEHGCMDSLTRLNLVTVDNGGNIYVPTAFTPNNDNNNELFIPTIVGVRKEDYMLRIYDRWGRRVFETNNVDEGWNGKIYGSDAVTDVYVWIVEGIFVTNEKFVRKGTVTLLR